MVINFKEEDKLKLYKSKSKKRKTKKRKRKSKRVKSKKESKNQKGGEPFLITLGVATALGLPGAFFGEAVKDGFEDHTELKTNAGKYISILSKILLNDQLKKLKDLKKKKEQLSFEDSPHTVVGERLFTTSEPEPAAAVASPRPEVQERIPPTRASLQSNHELNDIDQEILQLQTHVFQLIMSLQTKERIIQILKSVKPRIDIFHQRLRKSVAAPMGVNRSTAARGSVVPDQISQITEEAPLEEISDVIADHISKMGRDSIRLSEFYEQVIDSYEISLQKDLLEPEPEQAGPQGEVVTDLEAGEWLLERDDIDVSKIGDAKKTLIDVGSWKSVRKIKIGSSLRDLNNFFVDNEGGANHTNYTYSGAILKDAGFFDEQKTLIIIIKLLAIVEAESKTLAQAVEYLTSDPNYEINNSDSPMTFAYVKRLIAAMG